MSSQDSVPGNEGLVEFLARSSARSRVSGLLIDDLAVLVDHSPPWLHSSQLRKLLPSPTALPSAKPRRLLPFALSAWQTSRKPSMSFGNLSKPAAFSMLTRDRPMRVADAAQRQADPLLAVLALAVVLADGYQPPYLLAEIVGDVGEVDQLVGIEVRVVGPAEDDVGAGADVGRHGGLRPDVFPAFLVDPHLDAGLLGELLALLARQTSSSPCDEARPAQHAQLGALLDRLVELRASAAPGWPIMARAPAARTRTPRRQMSTVVALTDDPLVEALPSAAP